jgi:hypothetical protein
MNKLIKITAVGVLASLASVSFASQAAGLSSHEISISQPIASVTQVGGQMVTNIITNFSRNEVYVAYAGSKDDLPAQTRDVIEGGENSYRYIITDMNNNVIQNGDLILQPRQCINIKNDINDGHLEAVVDTNCWPEAAHLKS